MCGITGFFGTTDPSADVARSLDAMPSRGRDARNIHSVASGAVGHVLHSLVGYVEQPLVGTGVLVVNCEIYNWQDLAATYSLTVRNDADLLFQLLESRSLSEIPALLEELDGVFAFAYLREGMLVLARDILGVKPLWYCTVGGFSFASEKKALLACGKYDAFELNPRRVLYCTLADGSVSFVDRAFFLLSSSVVDASVARVRVRELLTAAVQKRVPVPKFGLLFSGGLDSSVLALLLRAHAASFTCYTCVLDYPGFAAPEDLSFAEQVASTYHLDLKIIRVSLEEVRAALPSVVALIEDSNVTKVGVALTFYFACRAAQADECKVLFSGLGSEELFAGYQRHKDAFDVNKECLSGLLRLYERDLYRDDVVSMAHGLELRLPFLDRALVSFALSIPGSLKLVADQEKYILRLVAADLGLVDPFVSRKKKAAQYGSSMHKALEKLSKSSGFSSISLYLRSLYAPTNVRLAALVSSGKDSLYALSTMLRQNYDVCCCVTIFSQNLDSYMFHTPTIELVRLQAQSMGIPLLEQVTLGQEEDELADLRTALARAQQEYGIQGVVCGALYSSYQRDRVEKVCDALGLKVFSPLWHVHPATYMRELLASGFSFVLSRVAADGLDASWLGRVITPADVDSLVALSLKNRFHVAFEGGEAETLVVDCPLFSQRLVLEQTHVVHDGTAATLVVDVAKLV